MNITADTLKKEYIPQISALEQVCFRTPWSAAAFEHELENPIAHYTVLLCGQTVAAYGGYWHIIDEGHITNIAVHPDYRRMGLGRRLLTDMINDAAARGIERMTLEVRVSNTAALALYDSLGFESAGIRSHYYPDGENAYIMWTEIHHAAEGK